MGVFEYDVDDILDVLNEWQPSNCKTEKQFESSLYRYLNEVFPKEIVRKQYTFANTKCDLYIHFTNGAKVSIEVKANLKDRNAYHRLIGQIWTYFEEWDAEILVILCGDCDPALLKSTRKFVKHLNDSFGPKMRFWPT